ncbi:phage protein (D protein) (Modular protein) [Xenorhabdus khoisanae]|uniref:Phage protein (D protein) (Modular protein) n=1 Tax=Xenorhabdus khoisanae TaxID=880157 RepID=A0A0J5FM37_9GAMM|nr:phage protein (D protein) (Modular protein) [Xenorhabdus khoisanae]KMJ43390.1 phage protein (D protein) (Modular protein) [Xenorhabdus khoisanae]
MIDFQQWIPSTDWVPQFDLITGKDGAPAFRLETNNKDITGKIQSRLMSLTLTDNRGLESDQLDIELDDADGKLIFPSRGDILILELGWHGHPLTPKGKFVVDEIEHSGAPDRLTVRARSADFRGDLNVKREASYHKHTLESIVSTIATRNYLQFQISDELKGLSMHIDQTNESDVSFLTRIAQQEGAIASVKNGELLFILQGQNKSASGMAIPPVLITRQSGDSHRFSLADREAYTGVVAQWWDTQRASKQTVTYKRQESKNTKVDVSVHYDSSKTQVSDKTVLKTSSAPSNFSFFKRQDKKDHKMVKEKNKKPGVVDLSKKDSKKKGGKTSPYDKPSHKKAKKLGGDKTRRDKSQSYYEEKQESALESHEATTETKTTKQEAQKYLQGTEENVLKLSRVYNSKEEAERAAEAVWKKLQRGAAQFSITLAKGRADIYPETPVQIDGFKPEINGTSWTIVKVTHNLNDSGFTTSLDLEIKLDDIEIKAEDTETKTENT